MDEMRAKRKNKKHEEYLVKSLYLLLLSICLSISLLLSHGTHPSVDFSNYICMFLPLIPFLSFFFSSLLYKLCSHNLNVFFLSQFRSKLESALMGLETSRVTGRSDLLTGMDDFQGNRTSSGAAVSHCNDPSSDNAGCYGELYRSASAINPTETDRSNRRSTTDVLRFVRLANSTIKQHVNEAARLDDMLQVLAENYFPETFNHGDLHSESLGYDGTINNVDATRDSGPAFQNSQLEGGGRFFPEKIPFVNDHTGKNIRFSIPDNSIGNNIELSGRESDSANKSRNALNMHINSDLHLLTADVGRAPTIARSSVQYNVTSVSTVDHDPLDSLTAIYCQPAGIRLGLNSAHSRSNSKSQELSSLTGKMPPRTFSTQLRRKELVVERKKLFEKGVLDTRFQSGCGDYRNDYHNQREDTPSI